MNIIIGREKEKSELESIKNSTKNELVCVYGRRRIGKTYLIKEYFENRFDFYYTGVMSVPNKRQLRLFQAEINECSGRNEKCPEDWFEAFSNLKRHLLSLGKKEVLVFIDELPWMDAKHGSFVPAFTNFWNTWDNHNSGNVILKCICCGSYASWMLSKLIGDKGGLYGRITRRIYLQPFTLAEAKDYFNKVLCANYSNDEVLDAYMILGGIPYYLSMIDKSLPLSVNVDNLLFSKNGKLREEYLFLFKSLFKNSSNYESIVELLATKPSGLTREEIIEATGIEGGLLTKTLDNLAHCDFIRESQSFGKIKKDKIYQLSDFYCIFYLNFVKSGSFASNYWTNILDSGKYNEWKGRAFEQICLSHVEQIRTRLGISGIVTSAYSWRKRSFVDEDGVSWKGGQIDLLIDRSDKIINVCEIKYSKGRFAITKDYKDAVLQRMELFKKATKTSKTLKCTFITSKGLKSGANSYFVDFDISSDALFSN